MKQDYTEIDSKFYQESDVVMLPTENNNTIFNGIVKGITNSRLDKSLWNTISYLQAPANGYIPDMWQPQHLYFLSNEEIKEGDWMYDTHNKYVEKCTAINYTKEYGWKKIIASTDKSLIIDYRENTSDFPVRIPRPSNEFLQRFCKEGGIDKCLVEYVDNGYEVDMEGRGGMDAGETCWMSKMELKVAQDNTITIKAIQEEKFYTESQLFMFGADMIAAIKAGTLKNMMDYPNWLKNNLPK